MNYWELEDVGSVRYIREPTHPDAFKIRLLGKKTLKQFMTLRKFELSFPASSESYKKHRNSEDCNEFSYNHVDSEMQLQREEEKDLPV
jgi:hypothetical protein